MLRHPIYILLCLGAAGYLAIADARGWSFIHSVSRSLLRAGGPRGAHSFNHK